MTMGNILYNALPYIYTSSGVVSLLTSGESIGRFSGALLVSAAMLVFHMRLEFRTRRALSAEESSLIATATARAQMN